MSARNCSRPPWTPRSAGTACSGPTRSLYALAGFASLGLFLGFGWLVVRVAPAADGRQHVRVRGRGGRRLVRLPRDDHGPGPGRAGPHHGRRGRGPLPPGRRRGPGQPLAGRRPPAGDRGPRRVRVRQAIPPAGQAGSRLRRVGGRRPPAAQARGPGEPPPGRVPGPGRGDPVRHGRDGPVGGVQHVGGGVPGPGLRAAVVEPRAVRRTHLAGPVRRPAAGHGPGVRPGPARAGRSSRRPAGTSPPCWRRPGSGSSAGGGGGSGGGSTRC